MTSGSKPVGEANNTVGQAQDMMKEQHFSHAKLQHSATIRPTLVDSGCLNSSDVEAPQADLKHFQT